MYDAVRESAEKLQNAEPYYPMDGVEARLRDMVDRLDRQVAALESSARSAERQAEAAKSQAAAAEKQAGDAKDQADNADKWARRSFAVAIAAIVISAAVGILQALY